MDIKRNKRGFTIVEILGVIVILGILAGVAIPLVTNYISRGKNLSYETMENTLYHAAKNYIMDENIYLNSCDKGFFDVEQGQDNILSDLQYAEKFVDPNDKSKNCIYNIYGCMENEASGAALPTYKYKIELKCINHLSCKIYRDDGSVSACDMTDDGSGDGPNDQTDGPKCGTYSPNNTTWSNNPSVTIDLNCEDGNSLGCEKETYTQTFTDEGKTGTIQIKDVIGNKTTCTVNTYIDYTAPSKPIITNPNDNKWVNNNYKIQINSVDNVSGIKYFEYRYPSSSKAEEREWKQWADSSKKPNDASNFISTDFSKERDELVEVRACDYAGNCSESSTTHIKIDKTKPTCSISVNGTKGANNWYVSNANLSLTFSDNSSGVSSYDLTNSQTATFGGKTTAVQNNTTGITYYGHVKDAAGNVGKCNSDVLKVDVDGPAIGNANINASDQTRYIVTSLSDYTSKINGYTVTNSDNVGTFIDISPVNNYDLKINVPPSASTYYIWARNEAGHISKKVVNIPALEYRISYNLNGGSGNVPSQTKIHDININLSSVIPTRNQYKFLGWATYPTATTPNYNAGSVFNLNQNITLYAVWKRTSLQITSYSCANKQVGSQYEFTYTGNCEAIDDGNGNWRIKFLTSGTFTPYSNATIDVFLVGGGGGGDGRSGGGGGYTTTKKAISINSGTSYTITIGAGGAGGSFQIRNDSTSGGSSTAFGYTAVGGKPGTDGVGGNGGSGGAGRCDGICNGAAGGSDGSNGGTGYFSGGSGQGTTTREFGEYSGSLYAGGGGSGGSGGAQNPNCNSSTSNGGGGCGAGGDGGGGKGGTSRPAIKGTNGAVNTGGGGGGGSDQGNLGGGTGGSGIVIIRKAR